METINTLQNSLSLAFDHYNRYPGETVTMFLKFGVPEVKGARLQVQMPKKLALLSTRIENASDLSITVADKEDDVVLTLPLDENFIPGQDYQLEIQAQINTFYLDHYLIIEARLTNQREELLDYQSGRLAVYGKGSYLRYLPEIYETDDFMSRFLMLFESFWKPINGQIDQIQHIFDPELAPAAFIPWLSAWLGTSFDEMLPKERIRKLIKNTMVFYQRRGTYYALKTYLEIFTDGEVEIIERRSSNFILGAGNTLGLDTALGKNNQPNTVSLELKLSHNELIRTQLSPEKYQRKVAQVVRSMIPAHVVFQLKCEFNPL
ncbi:MAG TPA: hypothetical protein DCY42_04710 [Chloroflexi bacterium]|nr:hypothetical protein [Chloroflexota bacterium]